MNTPRVGPHRRALRRGPRGERGYVLVTIALVLPVLLAFAAFTVDIGLFYSKANKVQRATDAAALAGVVFLPDLARATQAAHDAAKLNGFEDTAQVIVTQGDTPHRLQVRITDPDVKTIFGKLITDHISINRQSLAEFVGNIPLGSPYNAIGTGGLAGYEFVAGAKQNFWLSVNGYCAAKEDGDERLSRFDGTRYNSGDFTTDVYGCDANGDGIPDAGGGTQPTLNTDYTVVNESGTDIPSGYEYIVDVPSGVTPVNVDLFNPVFDAGAYYANDPACALPAVTAAADLLLQPANCPYSGAIDAATRANAAVRMSTHFRLYSPTADPNVWTYVSEATYNTCDSAYGGQSWADAPGPNVVFAPLCGGGDLGWVDDVFTLNTPGRWKVRVYTGANELASRGLNTFAIRAHSGASYAFCSSLVSAGCPSVSGLSAMSLKAEANTGGSTADIYLSRLWPAREYRGRQVTVTMWDVGEYMDSIAILNPAGATVPFSYKLIDAGLQCCSGDPATGASASGSASGGSPKLDTSGTSQPTPYPWGGANTGRYSAARYNDRKMQLTIQVPVNYGLDGAGLEIPDATFSGWWKVRYDPGASSGIQDRTTWTVALVGDPVHLIRG
jgi:hypothetical protein